MCKYYLDIKENLDLSDYSTISDYMAMVQGEDDVTISLNDNEREGEIVCSLLNRNDFIIMEKGRNEYGRLTICAQRKS